MKYMLLIMGSYDADERRSEGAGPTVAEFMDFEGAMADAGVKVDGAALDDPKQATSVQLDADSKPVVTNGPFAEAREYVGGYDVIDVPDLDAALDWAARCPGARYGRVEVRPLMEF